MRELTDKVVLITGAGSGIGDAVARRFAAQGAKVGVTGRREAPLKELAKEIGALSLPGDVSDRATVEKTVQRLVKEFGGLDIVVNNAGIAVIGDIEQISDEDWASVMDINLNGTRLVMRAVLPHLRARGGGAVVNISSIGALFAARHNAVYGTAKAALLALTKALARDGGPDGIRVNAVCPGWVDTPMVDPLLQMLSKERGITLDAARSLLVQFNPLNRMGRPEEIARCVEFLATDAASFVTGAVLMADGGQSIVDVGTLAFAPR